MANGFLTTSELDFSNYKSSLKTFLSQQDQFKDYDFEGSNISVLLDILAYNTYMNGVYLNMVGSEMFLDTATLRESIVSHAKELNYTPRSRTAAIAYVTLTITAADNPGSILIPKYYEVVGRTEDDTTYFFTTNEALIVKQENGAYVTANVAIYEGNIVKEVFVASDTSRYLLQSANVDVTSISVAVADSNTSTTSNTWSKETFLFGLDNNDSIFFVQGAEDHLFELVFGNGDIGKSLTDGNVVTVNYRETNGIDANGVDTFTTPNKVDGYTVSISNTTAAVNGSEHETDDEIKFNAPRYFPTQNRAITVEDYIALTKQAFPSLEVVTAYGGEEAEPKLYGKVIISAKPVGGTQLPAPLKTELYNYLKVRSAISIDPVIVDPEYFFAEVVVDVLYNINSTTRSIRDLEALVESTITTWGEDNLQKFGSDLRYSKLVQAINECEDSIISNDTTLRIVKHVEVDTGTPFRISFSFENQLKQEVSTTRKIYEDTSSTIETSLFTYTLGEIDYQAKIKDDTQGNLMIVSTVAGVVQLLQDKVGTIDYITGEIAISQVTYEDVGNNGYLEVYAATKKFDLETKSNKILQIESEHISVSVSGIRE